MFGLAYPVTLHIACPIIAIEALQAHAVHTLMHALEVEVFASVIIL